MSALLATVGVTVVAYCVRAVHARDRVRASLMEVLHGTRSHAVARISRRRMHSRR